MRKITKLKLATKHKKLDKKHMNKEVLSAIQETPQKKSLITLLKQTNPLVLISFGILCLVAVVLVVSLVSLIILNRNSHETGIPVNSAQEASIEPETSAQSSIKSKTSAGVAKIATPKPTPTLTPTPTPFPLPKGPQIYSVSAKNAVIIVKELYISALDTKIDDSQTMRLTLQDPKGVVNSVVIKLVTDKKSETHELLLKSGTGSDGVWEATWKADDTHDFIYQAQIAIKDGSGNSFSGTPSFR